MENPYRQQNRQYFDELVELTANHPRSYFSILKAKFTKKYGKSFDYLFKWICEQTSSKLTLEKHTLSTMVYWILHGMVDFPYCENCGKQIGQTIIVQLNGQYQKYCDDCRAKARGEHAAQTSTQKALNDPLYYAKICEKRKDTNQKEHGDPNWNNAEKNKQTCLDKYGVDNIRKTEYCKKKIKYTKKINHGDENYVNVEKAQSTCFDKYGVVSAMQVPEIRAKARTRYEYDNYTFDSKIEFCYYVWLKDHHIKFAFKPNAKFLYSLDGKEHFYMPDFKVNEQFVEIKGDHFFKEDGTMQNPYDHTQDTLYEAKRQCMLKNNVIILKQSECKEYVDYVINTYGNGYWKKFKLSIHNS